MKYLVYVKLITNKTIGYEFPTEKTQNEFFNYITNKENKEFVLEAIKTIDTKKIKTKKLNVK